MLYPVNKMPIVFLLLLLAGAAQAGPRKEWFRNLSLENAVASSDLILAAQVTEVTEIKLMRGGKGESAMFQYTFKPVRVLKGVFARDELSLGSSDLGFFRAAEMRAIRQEAFVLVFLGRSDVGYRNSNTFSMNGGGGVVQSMPPLISAKDPLLDTVRTLLAVNVETDRAKRVSLLIEGLNGANGPGAIALLDSIKRRALLAAQNPDVAAAITRHLTDKSPAVRESAAVAMRTILEADYLAQATLRESAVAKCLEALGLPDPQTTARAALIRALGAAGPSTLQNGTAMKLLTEISEPLNTIEQAARLRALGDLAIEGAPTKTVAWPASVPLDDTGEYCSAAEYAIARIQREAAVDLLNDRLEQKIAAGFSGRVEIEAFKEVPPESAIPALIRISKLPLNSDEKEALADTCGKLAADKPDARLVEPLSGLLTPDEPGRNSAVNALLKIDTDSAANALRTHLREEQDLFRKLQIAEMLRRHGIRDGYPFAIEHVSEAWLREQAVLALAAIKEPKAISELKTILNSSNDAAWNIAAVRGLGAMEAHDMTATFLKMIEDLRGPLAPAALIALGDLGERKALDKVREGLGSRNIQVVTASARAAGKLLALPDSDDQDIRIKLDALLGDPAADQTTRIAALNALLALKDERLNTTLVKVVRETSLENTELLQRVEKLLRERKLKLLPK